MRRGRSLNLLAEVAKTADERFVRRPVSVAPVPVQPLRDTERVYLDDPCYQYLPPGEPMGVVFAADEE